jgi:hypothetical protein
MDSSNLFDDYCLADPECEALYQRVIDLEERIESYTY